MYSLPPELLLSIIEIATECSSLYQSYELRLRTLSALTLVNHQFREIAQPLFPRTLYYRNLSEESAFSRHCSLQEVQKVAGELCPSSLICEGLRTGGFARLKEVRILGCGLLPLRILSGHSHLERLSLEPCWLQIPTEEDIFALSSLKELTFEQSTIILEGQNMRSDSFFTTARFPSLRALGIKTLTCSTPRGEIVHTASTIVPPSLLSQLDCITADEIKSRSTSNLSPTSSPPLPVPLLLDLDPRHTANFRVRRSSLASNSSPSHSHLRIRLPCEPISSHEDIISALRFAHKLVKESTILEELYLDFYSRDGRRGYVLEKQLEEKIKKLEEIARVKKVEIIWEKHEDDWCRSRVSKEFWKRCNEKKEKSQAK